jgi:hypothetical protein
MSAGRTLLSLTGVLVGAGLMAGMALGAAAAEAADAAAPSASSPTEAGSWQSHTYQFHYMGFTATYSCDGLADKLQLLLRLAGTRSDAKVMPSCARGYGVPDKLAEAQAVFSTLQPASAASPGAAASAGNSAANGVAGTWRHVELAPQHPFELQAGDCELVEQFRDTLLPMFATRNLKSQITCVPHQESGSNFSLSFDVLAPVPAVKGPTAKGPAAKGG